MVKNGKRSKVEANPVLLRSSTVGACARKYAHEQIISSRHISML
jgi:hypothetical protein